MKKRSILFLSAIALLGIATTSCDETEVSLANLNVSVEVASSFTGLSAVGDYVYIVNTVDDAKDSALVGETGIAVFTDLAPGSYNVSASMALTTEETEAASGYSEAITLNAVETSFELLAGISSDLTLTLNGGPSNPLVIKEFYYDGANDGYVTGFKDQYVEIYNNSAETVYADGLYLASIVPQTTGSDLTDAKSTLDFTQNIYADKVTRVPGAGTDYPIAAGESITIAFAAMDWSEEGTNTQTVNLLDADFELYAIDWLESLGRLGNAWLDIDNADVTNMEGVYLNVQDYGILSFITNGASVAILRLDEEPTTTIVNPESSETNPIYFLQLDVDGVIDAIDCLHDVKSGDYKRLPSSIDAGFTYVDGDSYSSLKVMRKVAKEVDGRVIYQDTNNSTEDFEQVHCTTGR